MSVSKNSVSIPSYKLSTSYERSLHVRSCASVICASFGVSNALWRIFLTDIFWCIGLCIGVYCASTSGDGFYSTLQIIPRTSPSFVASCIAAVFPALISSCLLSLHSAWPLCPLLLGFGYGIFYTGFLIVFGPSAWFLISLCGFGFAAQPVLYWYWLQRIVRRRHSTLLLIAYVFLSFISNRVGIRILLPFWQFG